MGQTVFSQLAEIAEQTARRSPTHYSLPAHTLKAIEQHGVGGDLIERMFGPRNKITKLTNRNEPLSEDQTDKAIRLLRIISLAEKVFRNPSKAMMWLNHEHRQFKAKPMDLLVRENGANLVEEMLLRIEYGVYA
ncbi:DUF2384 domain-containing protein [Methylobacterium sp. E-016]|uniref:antitoxin Xre/MbcA/ParS toxin-binding domain-containing protein n=1 Tax=Methylobacterium sp. E-016 TaxID=2836556 RepID=UPI001FBB173F|nr:antitoxin Xre/MbcA/ParS toxin-binding domain-containing protein [Methylobacterium sp. E-016]MCJ2077883.1 DUF2384 domain-containing protein [Methylobacterium sp. E-016]